MGIYNPVGRAKFLEEGCMKKFLVALFCVLSGVFNANAESVMGTVCEKIITGADGDYLLKCPLTKDLEIFKIQDANTVFASVVSQVNIADLIQEQGVIYVNVVPNGCAPDVPSHRFLIKDTGEYYTYEACI